MVAGLLPMDAGEALFDGKTLRDTVIGYVFQNYREALFPWKRAIDNIKYPLHLAGRSAAECDARAEELVASFDIRFDLRRYPYELSGGQQQLVSIMRALAPHPEVLFLDEPFSALDYEMTLFMRDKLQDIFEATKTTMILVSHDLEEAVYLADQVILLTRRPTRIAEVVPFAAPRPRRPETLTSDAFVHAKARCLEVFQREVRRIAMPLFTRVIPDTYRDSVSLMQLSDAASKARRRRATPRRSWRPTANLACCARPGS